MFPQFINVVSVFLFADISINLYRFLAKEYGLFRLEEDPTKCVWMENGRTLEYYLVRSGVSLP